MKMRQSLAQLERAFEQEMALEKIRRDQLRKRAAQRSKERRVARVEQSQKLRFSVLFVSLAVTTIFVIVVMFQVLAWVVG